MLTAVATWWTVATLAGLLVGAATGLALPVLALRGRFAHPEITTPDAVAEGRVLRPPAGAGQRFGWDRAWPLYLPHQGLRDAAAVRAGTRTLVARCWGQARSLWWRRGVVTGGAAAVVALPVLAGALAGLAASVALWHVTAGLAGGLLTGLQGLAIAGRRAAASRARTLHRTVARCPRCYAVTPTPGYLCTDTGCVVLHRDLGPGPLGIFRRRCACRTTIPTTVRSGGRQLASVCPACRRQLPQGSGTRRVVFLPVIGAVASGKTQFLSAAVMSIADRVSADGGELTAVSPVARAFLEAAEAAVTTGRRVAKTPWDDRPEGLPFRLRLGASGGGPDREVQLMDAAGEAFADEDRSRALVYFDTAEVVLLVLDPLALPKVAPLFDASDLAGSVSVATGDPTRPYASVVDRLRDDRVDLAGKHLGVVVSKADVVQELMGSDVLDAGDGAAVRRWLSSRGLGDFVARVERDFGDVGYFAVDSYGQHDRTDPLHPGQVLTWAFARSGLPLAPSGRGEAHDELEGMLR